MADKTAAMQRLAAHGVPIPSSVAITHKNIEELSHFCATHPSIAYCYLRFEERFAPDLPRVAAAAHVTRLVDPAVRNNHNLTVIVQERITAKHAGVMAVRDDALFIEHVGRELEPLLRAGVTPTRTLYSRTGELLRCELNQQEFACFWEGDQFTRTASSHPPTALCSITRDQLVTAATRIQHHAVLEWIEISTGEVIFLDHRPMQGTFLRGREELLHDFDTGTYHTLPTTTLSSDNLDHNGTCHLERPLFEHVRLVLPKAKALTFTAGAALAHLCVYASARDIPCTVSRPLSTST